MTAAEPRLADRADQRRSAFDRSFAVPRRLDATPQEDLHAIRLRTGPYALRLSEIAGLVADKKLTPVPGPVASFIGIAGFRGALLPVYHLPMLLGEPAGQTPRWLVIAQAAPIALGFEAFEGHLRVARDAILPYAADDRARPSVREFLEDGGHPRPLLHLPSVIEAIRSTQHVR